jgi:hypothetical protein
MTAQLQLIIIIIYTYTYTHSNTPVWDHSLPIQNDLEIVIFIFMYLNVLMMTT